MASKDPSLLQATATTRRASPPAVSASSTVAAPSAAAATTTTTSSSSASRGASSTSSASEVDWETRLLLGLLVVSTATLVYSGIQYYSRSRRRRRATQSGIDRCDTSLEISARGWRKYEEETPDSSGGALRSGHGSSARRRADSATALGASGMGSTSINSGSTSSMLGITVLRSLSQSLFGSGDERKKSSDSGISLMKPGKRSTFGIDGDSDSDSDDDSSSEDGNTSLVTYLSKSRANAAFLMECDLRQAYTRDHPHIYELLDRCFEGGRESMLLRKLHKQGNVHVEYTVTYRSRIIAYMCVTQVYARPADDSGHAVSLVSESMDGSSVGSSAFVTVSASDDQNASMNMDDESSDDEALHTASFVSKTQHTLERYTKEVKKKRQSFSMDSETSVSAPAMLLSGTSGISSRSHELVGLGIGPLCVDLEFRRRRLASYLIETLAASVSMYPYLCVLGEPDFYSRLSFKAAGKFGIRSKWTGLDSEHFMVRFLSKSRVLNFLSHSKSESRQFVIEYPSEFDMFDDENVIAVEQ